MFFGVYCTTMYELMMVLISTHALRTGTGEIPGPWERGLHLACVAAGVAALVGYYLRSRDIQLDIAAIIASTNYTGNFAAPQLACRPDPEALVVAQPALPSPMRPNPPRGSRAHSALRVRCLIVPNPGAQGHITHLHQHSAQPRHKGRGGYTCTDRTCVAR